MTQLSATLGFSHLLIATGAELALLDEQRLYLGNRKLLPDAPSMALEAAHRASPTNGTHVLASFGFRPSPWMWSDIDVRYVSIQIDLNYC